MTFRKLLRRYRRQLPSGLRIVVSHYVRRRRNGLAFTLSIRKAGDS